MLELLARAIDLEDVDHAGEDHHLLSRLHTGVQRVLSLVDPTAAPRGGAARSARTACGARAARWLRACVAAAAADKCDRCALLVRLGKVGVGHLWQIQSIKFGVLAVIVGEVGGGRVLFAAADGRDQMERVGQMVQAARGAVGRANPHPHVAHVHCRRSLVVGIAIDSRQIPCGGGSKPDSHRSIQCRIAEMRERLALFARAESRRRRGGLLLCDRIKEAA